MMLLSSLLVGFVSYKHIKLSATLMLWLEFLSVGLILVVAGIALSQHGTRLDQVQLRVSDLNFENVRMGLVMAIFGFVAFESAASLGDEARQPLKTVPKAIMRSVIFSGLFFVVVSYAMVMSFHSSPVRLDHCATPLLTMASLIGLPGLGQMIDVGIMISFFAAGLANLNAAARIIYKMSHDGFFHRLFANTHDTNRTPHFAVVASSVISLLIALVLVERKIPLMDIVGYLGTLATFGFIYAYIATSLSAAKVLGRIDRLSVAKMFVVAASIFVLAVALIGSLVPSPPSPYNILPVIFIAYITVGVLTIRKSHYVEDATNGGAST